MPCYTLYGSPHSLPTYKVALMLRMSGQPFSFRYVSFQKGMHQTPEFQALSRWGQVPVLVEDERIYSSQRPSSSICQRRSTASKVSIRRRAKPFENGYSGMSMRCFPLSSAVTPPSWTGKNFCH